MIKAIDLSQAIAMSWEHIVLMLGDDCEHFEFQLIALLRRLDCVQEPDQAVVIQSILELFQKFDAAHELLIQAIRRVASRSKGVDMMPAAFTKMERYTSVPVFYGTDRAAVSTLDEPISYGVERGNLTFGVAEVSIPDDHRMGKIERPGVWKLQFREDPKKHVVVLSLEQLSSSEFVSRAQDVLNRNSNKEVLLFIHGYNVGFTDALSRAAQIAYDLKFDGMPALYSWPSEASLPKYTVDENNIIWSRPRFAQFLSIIRENLGAKTIHIIAHSMGNRLVAETIASMTQPVEPHFARFRQIVLLLQISTPRRLKTSLQLFMRRPSGSRYMPLRRTRR